MYLVTFYKPIVGYGIKCSACYLSHYMNECYGSIFGSLFFLLYICPCFCPPPLSRDVDEVLRRANATEYGLASGVFTRDISKALYVSEKLNAGTVFVNTYNKTDVAAPFGGFKQSGFGKDLGEPSLLLMCLLCVCVCACACWTCVCVRVFAGACVGCLFACGCGVIDLAEMGLILGRNWSSDP